MLVKLTEVCNNGAVTTNKHYSLREIFINPEHVVMIREEKRMKELNERGKVTEIVVVGSPDMVESTLKTGKRLLKG